MADNAEKFGRYSEIDRVIDEPGGVLRVVSTILYRIRAEKSQSLNKRIELTV
jgi:hypothetical protein